MEKPLILELTDEEIVEFTLPRIVDVVPPADVFLEGSSCSSDVFQKLVTFREQISLRFPELKTFFYPSTSSSISYQDPKQKFIDMVLENKSACCEWLLEIGDCSLVKDSLMPFVVSIPPHAVRTYLVSRDIALNQFYPTWRVFTDYLTLATRMGLKHLCYLWNPKEN